MDEVKLDTIAKYRGSMTNGLSAYRIRHEAKVGVAYSRMGPAFEMSARTHGNEEFDLHLD